MPLKSSQNVKNNTESKETWKNRDDNVTSNKFVPKLKIAVFGENKKILRTLQ